MRIEWEQRRTGYKMADYEVGYRGRKFDPYCFQRQLRDSKDIGERVGLNGDIREIPFQEAQAFILQFEWLGTMGTTKFSYGLFVEDKLTAVLCFGLTAGTQALSQPFGEPFKSQGIVLVRGACAPWAHPHTASYLMGKVFPLVRERGYRFIIAYSDLEAGEIGTVYQATNWQYYGLTAPVTYLVRPDGKRVDPKLIHKYSRKNGISSAEQKQIFFDEGYILETGSPKLKYIKLIGNKRENKELMSHCRINFYPYLKRKENMKDVLDDAKIIIKKGGIPHGNIHKEASHG